MGSVIEMPHQEQSQTAYGVLEDFLVYVKNLEKRNAVLQKENEKLKDNPTTMKMFDALPDILTAQDIADYLHISRYKAYEILKISPSVGGIESFEMRGRSVRCMKSDLKKWLDNQKKEQAHGVRRHPREK